ncbi:hypothetical protein BLNAU_3992 [Blattamonas nauphoetae]|uniref:Uncharacterized protein n=1 Tax=Blattamonas nauphoetae TaxID=2049346 RepID=A0ABQ9YB49_9EUKA|nr:hypothetical protein BLNAU_3992 [Blattamonas nauphoetae]
MSQLATSTVLTCPPANVIHSNQSTFSIETLHFAADPQLENDGQSTNTSEGWWGKDWLDRTVIDKRAERELGGRVCGRWTETGKAIESCWQTMM